MDFQIGRFYLTVQGANLQSLAQTGFPITYTKVEISEQEISDYNELVNLKRLKAPVDIDVKLRDVKLNQNGMAQLITEISNEGLTRGIFQRTMGIYAQHPELGEILFAVANNGEYSTFIPPYSVGVQTFLDEITVTVGNATEVKIIVDGNPIYALNYDLMDLAGIGRQKETVKENADRIGEMKLDISLIQAQLGINNGTGMISITFDDIEKEHVLDGIWDKEAKRMVI